MKNTDFAKLIQSIKQAGEIKAGIRKPSRVFIHTKNPDIKSIRNKLHVSQSEFALMIGVSPSTIQNWEQGRREPEGPAKALLCVAEKNPKAVLEALHY
jgi:putative transcriptional regulator